MPRLDTIFATNEFWKACFLPARRLELRPRVRRHVTSTLTATDNVARVIATVQYHFLVAVWRAKEAESRRLKRYWEIIADNLKKAGWRLDWVSTLEHEG